MEFLKNNFLVRQLKLNGEGLTAVGDILYLNGQPLITSTLSVLITGDQYVEGIKEFASANIRSGEITVDGIDTPLRVLKDNNDEITVNWDDGVLFNEGFIGQIASLDWKERVLNAGDKVENLEVSLNWDLRILSGNWSVEDPQSPSHIANKRYVDDKVIEIVGEGLLRLVVTIPNETDSLVVTHPDLGGETMVVGGVENGTGEGLYLHQISNKTSSGFTLLLSDDTDTNDYKFNCLVSRKST